VGKVSIEVWFVAVFGDVLWMGVGRFARGDRGGFVMSLLRAFVGGLPGKCMWSGEVSWFAESIGALGVARKYISARLSPCSLRM
jgi:hypothetical protein